MTDHLLARGQGDYPSRLAELPNPPLSLRARGAWPLPGPWVAIVGTRRADPEGLAFARGLARALAEAGQGIVSGGALGIDSAAHEGALDVGGRTLAILPTGLSPAYPRRNEPLFARIVAASGALVSEMPDGAAAQGFRFLRRNALIAALADAVVVVQAPRGSGATSTAAAARALGRPLFVMPTSPWDPRGEGSLELLRAGARICVGAEDVLSVTAPTGARKGLRRAPPRGASGSSDLEGDERKVWLVLGSTPRHPDEIGRSTGLPEGRVHQALVGLLLAGRVDERGGGRYVTAPRNR